MDSELTPQEGQDPGLMPADQEAETWKVSPRGHRADNPLGEGPRESSQGPDRPATPAQPPSPGGYPPSSSYDRPAGSPGYQPGPSGSFADTPPSVFDRPAAPAGYEPSAQPGYGPAGRPAYPPQAQPGYSNPAERPGFPPSAQPGYGAAGRSAYQPQAQPGYNSPPAGPGYQPSAGAGYQPPADRGYQPPADRGYQPPADRGYQPPADRGYQPPAQPGYQPPAAPGYDRPAGPSGYQPPAAPGYDRPAGPSGYQPPAQPGYQSVPPLSGGPAQPVGYGAQAYQSAQPTQGYQGTQPYQQGNPYQQTQSYQAAQPQQGYGTGWPTAALPPQRKRNKGMLIGIIVVVAALAVGGVAAFVALRGGESPAQMAMQAGQAIAPARGVTVSGTYGQPTATLTITRAGTVEGTYSQGPFAVTRLTINGVTYLKAPAGFWNLQTDIPQGASSLAAGKWSKTPSADVTDFSVLAPGAIANVLEHVGNQPHVVNTTLGGTSVIKLTAQDASYYITTSSPNRLLRIAGTINGTGYSFNVTPLTTQTIASAFTTMQSDVSSLQDAVDPEAQIDEDGNGQFGNNCNNDVACTVSVNVSVTDSGSSTVIVKMTANFSGTKNGTAFGSCNDTVPANTADSSSKVTVTASCTLQGQTWSGWFDSHTSNFTLWVATQSEPVVNSASDVAALQNDLKQEQG
jgi:hypothetical protein